MGPEMYESGSKTSTVPIVWTTFGIFSLSAIQTIFYHDWWPWTKTDYITMTRRQSNSHWSDGIVVHSATKKFGCKNPLIIFQRPKLSTRSITHLCWRNWRTFWRKNAKGRSPRGSCSCTTLPRLTGHLQPRRTGLPRLPMSWSPTLFSGSGPVRLPSVPWTEKQLKGHHFSFDAKVIAAGETCLDGQISEFFLVAYKSNGLRSVLSFVGSKLNKSRVWSL